MRIALVANTSWYIYNFRYELIKQLILHGNQVQCFSNKDNYSEKLQIKYCENINWNVTRTTINPFHALSSIYELFQLIRKNNIDVILSFTPKGNLFGCVAAYLNQKPIINNISGLGRIFINQSYFTLFLRFLFNKLLKNSHKVFFQNSNDIELLINKINNKKINIDLIPGSGVNLDRFISNRKLPKSESEYDFLLIARMIKEKGIYDFIEAARLVRKKYKQTRFALLGFIENNHKSAITLDELNKWDFDGLAKYLGSTDKVDSYIERSNCIVLPSYYGEGIPRILLEASSMEKPIITTNNPGCKDAIEDGLTGLLCNIKDPHDLADKMIKIIQMGSNNREKMGKCGRKKMINEFDEKIIINKYLEAINDVFN